MAQDQPEQAELLNQWCIELRKPEAKQCRMQLHAVVIPHVDGSDKYDGFCCLGLLGYRVLSIPLTLLTDKIYLCNIRDVISPLKYTEEQFFAWLNDNQQLNFTEIALVIENLPREEWKWTEPIADATTGLHPSTKQIIDAQPKGSSDGPHE